MCLDGGCSRERVRVCWTSTIAGRLLRAAGWGPQGGGARFQADPAKWAKRDRVRILRPKGVWQGEKEMRKVKQTMSRSKGNRENFSLGFFRVV